MGIRPLYPSSVTQWMQAAGAVGGAHILPREESPVGEDKSLEKGAFSPVILQQVTPRAARIWAHPPGNRELGGYTNSTHSRLLRAT